MISIIIPIRNEVKSIKRTIDSILYQNDMDQQIEILIADGMSHDGTREIIEDYHQNNENIHLIDNSEQIVAIGFNRALSIARGNYIIRIDGHSKIEHDFIKNSLKLFATVDADCVGGATQHVASGIIGDAIRISQTSRFGVGVVPFRLGSENGRFVDTLAFGVYKREVFEKLGGYDEELVRNQDDEFNFRLIQNGGKIWLDPSIKSTYYTRISLFKLFKQYFQYGFYKIRVMQKRKGFASWRHLFPGIFVLALFLSFILIPTIEIYLPIYLIACSYAVANILATLWEALKQIINQELRKNYFSLFSFILMPLVFFTLHFSYGLGFICGLFYFWDKWNDTKVKDYHFDQEQFSKNTVALDKPMSFS